MAIFNRNTGKTTRKIMSCITDILRNKQNAVLVSRDYECARSACRKAEKVLQALDVPYNCNANLVLSIVTLQDNSHQHIRFLSEAEWKNDEVIYRAREGKAHFVFDVDNND